MKTILHIFSGDLWAGAEVMVFSLLKKLKDCPDMKIVALSLNRGTLTDKLQKHGIETYIIPESNNSFLEIFRKALNLFKNENIDIIHAHRYKENLLALLLSRFTGVKRLITTLHGLPEPHLYGENKKTSISWKTKMHYLILKHFFACVVPVSREMKNTLVRKHQFNPQKIEVIHNGIEIPEFTRSTNQPINYSTNKHFHIGTVGRMVPVKNFDFFLEIAAEIRKQAENVRFSILGDGPLKEQLIEKAKYLKVEDSIEFIPPNPNPFPYYQSLDLYLNTSLHEGIPLAILEAMACGKPIVAPKAGGIPEIILDKENGLLIEKREPAEFIRSCMMLIKNEDLRMKMSEKNPERIALHFSNVKMADCYKKLYMNLAADSRR